MGIITDLDYYRDRGNRPSPSYTLAELERLAKQWADENEATNDARWIVSGLLAWLGKKEREGNVDQKS